MGDEIVQQALEVAKLQSEAEIEQAKANAAFEERIGAQEERAHHREDQAAETAITIAEIQAERDVKVAEIVADAAQQHEDGCCESCRSKFAELERRLGEHERSMGERLSILERAEPRGNDVEKVPVKNIYTDRGKEDKKHTVKSASKPVRKDSLYFGR